MEKPLYLYEAKDKVRIGGVEHYIIAFCMTYAWLYCPSKLEYPILPAWTPAKPF
jgi:hypothetical protein